MVHIACRDGVGGKRTPRNLVKKAGPTHNKSLTFDENTGIKQSSGNSALFDFSEQPFTAHGRPNGVYLLLITATARKRQAVLGFAARHELQGFGQP